MGVSFLANWWANSQTSKAMQYLGLGLYVVAEAIIFVPLLFIAANYGGGGATILKAGIVSLGLFAGLTAVVFITQKDFSFLGPILAIGGFIALGFIAASLLFGFSLGSFFAFVMVGICGNGDFVQHFKCASSISHDTTRRGFADAVCECRFDVLVYFDHF